MTTLVSIFPKRTAQLIFMFLAHQGVDKSKALANWIFRAYSEQASKQGCGAIDPHGDLVKDVLSHLFDFS